MSNELSSEYYDLDAFVDKEFPDDSVLNISHLVLSLNMTDRYSAIVDIVVSDMGKIHAIERFIFLAAILN